MTLLSIALLSPFSWTAIGAPLGNHLWQSTVFAGAAWLLTLLLQKNHAQSRYVLWLLASAKFLIPFSLLIALGSHIPWARTPAATQPAVFLAMETLSEPFAPVHPTQVPPPTLSALEVAARSLPAFLLVVWSGGCFAVLLVWYLRWQRLTAARRAALPLRFGRELEALRRMEQTTHLPRQIDLLLSNSALEPGILGVFRPALLLPAGISDKLTDAQLESIIAHELCHVRRRDNLAAALHMLVEAIFWFYPLVWWMGARLVDERERACDEEVLRLGADPHAYAESILKVCKFYLESPLFCAAGVTGSNLKKRIEAIMSNHIARNLE
jgi:beta-lactamase regulating signal transducer with metallopeptidase domain